MCARDTDAPGTGTICATCCVHLKDIDENDKTCLEVNDGTENSDDLEDNHNSNAIPIQSGSVMVQTQVPKDTDYHSLLEMEEVEIQDSETEASLFSQITNHTDETYYPSSQSSDGTNTGTVDKKMDHLNQFIEACNITLIGIPRKKQWQTYSSKTKNIYLSYFKDVLKSTISCLFPDENEMVLDDFFNEFKNQTRCDLPENAQGTNEMIESLIDSYQKAESWQLKRQILSILSVSKSYKEVLQLIPDLTEYRYYVAKNHAITKGCALPPAEKDKSRKKMDPAKLDSFLDFITSSHIVKDLPFGQRKLKTTDGSIIETPNIIRCMAPQAIIDQYKQYCEENEIEHLGTSTMFRILQSCTATVRKSLEGLDYFLAEGGHAIDDLIDIISSIGLNEDDLKKFRELLLGTKRYLKADYKVHVAESSTVADHCRQFALSSNSPDFQTICDHEHTDLCESCEQIHEVLHSVRSDVEGTCFDGRDDEDDINFRLLHAERSINFWKMHSLRAKNQDAAKQRILNEMVNSEVLIILDWAMKFLPKKFREDSLDWFAKRGISWHISMVFRKRDGLIESLPHIHIFQGQIAQDASVTTAVIIDVVESVTQQFPDLTSIHLWSDNAGCYKSSETLSTIFHHCKKVKSYDFCEPQDGKGACDRTAATIKSGIRRYINQGHDVVTAQHMKVAIDQMKSTFQYKVKLVDINTARREKFHTIPGISTYNNFQFANNGILVWKFYGIGQGKLIREDQLENKHPIQLTTVSDWQETAQFHKLSSKKTKPQSDRSTLFTCENPGCIESFETATEFQDHLVLGQCVMTLEREKTGDRIKYMYADKLQLGGLRENVTLIGNGSPSSGTSDLQKGWAVKVDRKCVRFYENQKSYLTLKFDEGNRTGRKEDPVLVAEEMRKIKKEDGSRRFTFNELLTPLQIASFFSRVCKKSKMEDKDVMSACREGLIDSLCEHLNNE